MRKYIPKINRGYILRVILLSLVYYIIGKVCLGLYSVNTFATLIWPPTGLALAALIMWGYNLWPAVLIGAFCVNFFTGASVLVACGIAVGNALEAIVGTYLLRHFIKLYRCFERLHDTLGFILFGALGGTLISATIGTLTLLGGGLITTADFFVTWFTWWIGDVLGALIITPFLITCVRPTRPWNPDKLQKTEIFAFFLVLITLNILVFWHPLSELRNVPLLYLILIPLIWGGLRFGSRGMTFSIFITSVIAVTSIVLGRGPIFSTISGQDLLFTQIFIGSISITFLIFLSIVKERVHAIQDLENSVKRLEQAVEEVSSADQAKSNFVAVLAHELRNPLSPILSSLELIKIEESGTEILKLADTIETHVQDMSKLLDDLLDISRISKEKLSLERKNIDLKIILERSVKAVEPLINTKNHSLTVSLPENPVWFRGDPLRLEQIIVNILNNAIKYTDSGGAIELHCVIKDDNVIISVRDNGIGIRNDMLQRIFEPFQQVSGTGTRSGKGLGIGLSLTKKLTEMHGGSIVAKSKGIGKGSEFIVTLPIPKMSPMISNQTLPLEQINAMTDTTQKNKLRILIVDDNEPAAVGLSKLLIHKGHETSVSYDGPSALRVIKEFNPHVVILDIGLPDMDGYEVAQKIRQKYDPGIVLLAITGYGQDDDKQNAKKSGFNYHLTKPVGIADVETILEQIIL